MTTPAVNVPDEIVKKVDALMRASHECGRVAAREGGPGGAWVTEREARTDLLAAIARHTPAPPADEELREAVERCKRHAIEAAGGLR